MGKHSHSKKIVTLGGLLLIREFWGLLCNLYQMVYQPFLTIRTIRAKKDKSQVMLIIMAAVLPLIAYSIIRLVTDYLWYGTLLNSVGLVFMGVLLTELLIFSYLFYWTIVVLKKNHKGQFIANNEQKRK